MAREDYRTESRECKKQIRKVADEKEIALCFLKVKRNLRKIFQVHKEHSGH